MSTEDKLQAFLYKQTSDRAIPHFKKNRKVLFKKQELEDWLTEQSFNLCCAAQIITGNARTHKRAILIQNNNE